MKNFLQITMMACCGFCITSPTVLAQINKCVVNGQTTYTDKPCQSGSERPIAIKPLNILPAAEAEDTSSPKPRPEYNSSRWYEDSQGYRQAVRVSRARDAPILIYTYADWCKFCKRFETELLPKPRVKRSIARYVKVRLNPEHSNADKALFDKWGGKGYPTLYVQDTPNHPPHKIKGLFVARGRTSLIIPEDELISILDRKFGITVDEQAGFDVL